MNNVVAAQVAVFSGTNRNIFLLSFAKRFLLSSRTTRTFPRVAFAYSKALAEYGGDWGYEELAEFLYKPKKYIKGTKMNFAGLKKVEDRANLVLFLREHSDSPVPLP